jgi:hypothetical protein
MKYHLRDWEGRIESFARDSRGREILEALYRLMSLCRPGDVSGILSILVSFTGSPLRVAETLLAKCKTPRI